MDHDYQPRGIKKSGKKGLVLPEGDERKADDADDRQCAER